MAKLCDRALRAVSFRGSAVHCVSSSLLISATLAPGSASSTTCESGPCSAWDSRSAATCAGFAPASATTNTSEGPAGISMDTMASEFCSSILAAVTNWLPGPRILSTLGQLAVPHAIADTACAPPAFKMCVAPAFFAQYSTSGVMEPSGRGGVASTMVLQPAMAAGTASMRAEEGRTAVPPGTYRPTDSMGLDTRRQFTPGMVSTDKGAVCCCAAWKALIFAYATSKAAVTSAGNEGVGSSSIGTHTLSSSTRSNLEVYSFTAASPLCFTCSTMGATVLRMEEKSTRGRISKERVCSSDRSP
mmetsp:Transcript_20356/g.56717  ORF Transcript_20356/g.56717 Transcript_20356/m.56717 type:complete len:302 (+) Transcript_20356:1264-2169(+)